MKKLLFISFIFTSSIALSQGKINFYNPGKYVPLGESRILVSGNFTAGENLTDLGGYVGYGYDGVASLGLEVDNRSYDSLDVSSTLWGISLAIYPLQILESPSIRVLFGIGYYRNSISELNTDFETLSSFATIYLTINLSAKISIVPEIGIKYDNVGVEINGESESDGLTYLPINIGFIFHINTNMILYFTPQVMIGLNKDGNTFYGGSGGLAVKL